jgi:hypothetical protein
VIVREVVGSDYGMSDAGNWGKKNKRNDTLYLYDWTK